MLHADTFASRWRPQRPGTPGANVDPFLIDAVRKRPPYTSGGALTPAPAPAEPPASATPPAPPPAPCA
jgi:hypothetical protein